MDFELFNDTNSEMDLSSSGVEALMSSASGSTPPDSMMLSLDEQLLSSFDDSKPLPLRSSSRNSSGCYYFYPDLTTNCTLVDTIKDDVNGQSVDDKLFLKNEENSIWVIENKDGSIGSSPEVTSSCSITSLTDESCSGTPAATQFLDVNGNNIKALEGKPEPDTGVQFNIQSSDSASPSQSVQTKRKKALTVSRKRKLGMTRTSTKSLQNVCQSSKSSSKWNSTKSLTTKVFNGGVRPIPETFLSNIADTVTEQISKSVRHEIQNVMDGFKTYLDEKLSLQSTNKATHCGCKPGDANLEDDSSDKSGKENCMKIVEVSCKDHPVSFLQKPASGIKLQSKEISFNFDEDASKNKEINKTDEKATNPVVDLPSELNDLNSSNESFEQRRIATVNTLLKYVTSPSLVATLKKSIENCSITDVTECASVNEQLNPTDILNMSIGSMESQQTQSNDAFTFPKFSLGMIKQEPFSDVEYESSRTSNYLDLFTTKTVHFLEDQEQEAVEKAKEEVVHAPIPNSAKPCTDVVPYVPVPSSQESVVAVTTRRRNKGEKTPKPELPLRKYRKQLACEICDRSFLNNSSLKQHMSFHRPQRPYQCDHAGCDKSYKTRSELNRHLVVHRGEKNYECQKCGKLFLRKQYLKTHLIRHNEGLTWQCTLCTKIFVSEEDLDKHKLSYHKNGKRSSRLRINHSQKLALTYHPDHSLEA